LKDQPELTSDMTQDVVRGVSIDGWKKVCLSQLENGRDIVIDVPYRHEVLLTDQFKEIMKHERMSCGSHQIADMCQYNAKCTSTGYPMKLRMVIRTSLYLPKNSFSVCRGHIKNGKKIQHKWASMTKEGERITTPTEYHEVLATLIKHSVETIHKNGEIDAQAKLKPTIDNQSRLETYNLAAGDTEGSHSTSSESEDEKNFVGVATTCPGCANPHSPHARDETCKKFRRAQVEKSRSRATTDELRKQSSRQKRICRRRYQRKRNLTRYLTTLSNK
jgi:hypothetical protein